jgi:phosphocarrier protein HPr
MSGIEDLDGDLPDRREPADAVVQVVEIVNKKGLHARASAKFVQCVERFDATVTRHARQHTVGGTSIMGLMMLAAGHGAVDPVEATGPEAAAPSTPWRGWSSFGDRSRRKANHSSSRDIKKFLYIIVASARLL